MDKQNVEYPYNEIIFSNKSEQITDRHNMNKSQNQWKKLGKKNCTACMIPYIKFLKMETNP